MQGTETVRVAATSAKPAPPRTVAEIMTAPVLVAAPATTVGDARLVQRQLRIRHLPVLQDGLLVGIVSDRDLRGAPDGSAAVAAVMTRTVFVLSPEASLRQAARLFRERRFDAMPVLRGRELAGIVSVVDVARALEERLWVDRPDGSC